MNKRDIIALDDTELIAHAMQIESQCTKEENMSGITVKTKKDYIWTIEELCKRFNLDFDRFVGLTGLKQWW